MSAAHRRGLEDTLTPWRETVKPALVHLDATAEETAEDIRAMEEARP